MATKITDEDKIRINELYLKYRTYAAVARETGFAASTVKKYVIPGYTPRAEIEVKTFTVDNLPEEIDYIAFSKLNNLGILCTLSASEVKEIEELWEELVL